MPAGRHHRCLPLRMYGTGKAGNSGIAAGLMPVSLSCALRTDSFHGIIDGIYLITLRQCYDRGLYLFQTGSLPAYFTIKMNVPLLYQAVVGKASAYFVLGRAASVFKGMDDMMLQKNGKRAEKRRLVEGVEQRHQFDE